MQISSLDRAFREAVLEFALGQWTQMGVAGTSARMDSWAIDPEALLIFTLDVTAGRDIRLFDEVLDWLVSNGHLVSSQRLKNLAKERETRLLDASLAWAGRRNPALRSWRSVPRPPTESEPSIDFGVRVQEPDEVFLEFGIWRPTLQPSGKSTEPVSILPVNLPFRLRLMFGVGSRAEVLRYLLTTERLESDVRQIADAAAYAKRNVSETLTYLVQARVLSRRWRGNEQLYRIDHESWGRLLGGRRSLDLPRFVDWVRLLPAARQVLEWLQEQTTTSPSDYILSSGARRLVARLQPSLDSAGINMPDLRLAHGIDFWPVFVEIAGSIVQRLGPPGDQREQR